jgi:carbon monoxide dehydrogenase subunit G
MEIEHQRTLARPPEVVWEALNDPEILCACAPGCEAVERLQPDYFVAHLSARVGPIQARVEGTIRIVDPEPPNHYTLAFAASGRAFGHAEGRTYVQIHPAGTGSRIAYRVAVTVSGRLARMGHHVINKVAMRLMDRFFDRFDERLRG